MPRSDDESLNRTFANKFMSVRVRNVVGNAPAAVSAMLDIYNTVLKEVPPTQAKSHYTLNMCDVSKVFQGICQCTQNLSKIEYLVNCWLHARERIQRQLERNPPAY